MAQVKTTRYVALDVLRGMTVAGMILVNNPGSWGHIFSPLRHASWAGCTPTDLVFPFFLFVVGAAMAFSFAKYGESLSKASVKKLLIRGALIFLVGLALNAFPFIKLPMDPDHGFWWNVAEKFRHLRIFGVLQRIAMCYVVGGLILQIDQQHAKGELEILFVNPEAHSKGIGQAAWKAVEAMHPEIRVWETITPYFEKRNIHFYVNRLGFHIVEFWNKHHHGPAVPEDIEENWSEDDEMFVFRKFR